MSLYNRTPLVDFTRADATDIDNETAKIEAAINQLDAQIQSLDLGAGTARYTWTAYADSDDGTVSFSHDPGNRAYVGLAGNKLTPTPSDFPEDYAWSLIRGSDAPTLRLVANQPRFDFNVLGAPLGASEVLFTAEGTNLATTITFAAENDSGSAVDLTSVNATQVKLDVDDFGAASWVRVTATANGGAVSDSSIIVANRQTRPLTYRGTYRVDVEYDLNNIVFYNGSSFIALRDDILNHAPDTAGESNAYWGVLARGGAVGDPATPDTAVSTTINLTSSSETVNLRSIARAAGYRGKANATINFVVPAGVVITGKDGGGVAIDSGLWPDTEYTIALTLTVQSGGVVRGGGGNGGKGWGFGPHPDGTFGDAGNGGDGGDAIFCRTNMTVNINAGGTVSSGGGGGDAGRTHVTGWPNSSFSAAGGGGGGFPNGLGGVGVFTGTSGANGTVAGGGIGGTPGGTIGGSAGAAASPGGDAGYAVRKNGHTVAVTNSGTMQGTAA